MQQQQQQHAQLIREHMEVVGSDNGHVGTVDKVEGGRIKLTRKDDPDGTGAHHHYLSLDAVASVSGDQVRLSVPAEQAMQGAVGGGGGGPAMGMGTGGVDRGMGAQVGVSGAGSMVSGNPGLAGGLGSLGLRDGVADLGPSADSTADTSGDTAPGTIGGRPGSVGTSTGGRSTGG
jgi:hypothetical protein